MFSIKFLGLIPFYSQAWETYLYVFSKSPIDSQFSWTLSRQRCMCPSFRRKPESIFAATLDSGFRRSDEFGRVFYPHYFRMAGHKATRYTSRELPLRFPLLGERVRVRGRGKLLNSRIVVSPCYRIGVTIDK